MLDLNHTVALIQYSDGMKETYKMFQSETPDAIIATQASLGLARHRFDSQQHPSAVFILTMHCVHMFAIHLYTHRRNETCGKHALHHLAYSSGAEGVERQLTMGMLTDAADEGLLMTRFYDNEDADTSLLLAQSNRFLKTIKVLFIDGKALETGSGSKKMSSSELP